MLNALGIFAKEPVPGKVKTRLVPPFSLAEAAGLYRCMLRDTMARFCALPGIDSYIFFEGDQCGLELPEAVVPRLLPQEGSDLGGRLTNAFDRLFRCGYGKVALIGTDSPDLPLPYVNEAFACLSAGTEAAFGPSNDGGYYLVALSRACHELFGSIPWSTGAVLARSLENARSAGIGTALLPEWYDLDTFDDLNRVGQGGGGNAPLTWEYLSLWYAGNASAAEPRS